MNKLISHILNKEYDAARKALDEAMENIAEAHLLEKKKEVSKTLGGDKTVLVTIKGDPARKSGGGVKRITKAEYDKNSSKYDLALEESVDYKEYREKADAQLLTHGKYTDKQRTNRLQGIERADRKIADKDRKDHARRVRDSDLNEGWYKRTADSASKKSDKIGNWDHDKSDYTEKGKKELTTGEKIVDKIERTKSKMIGGLNRLNRKLHGGKYRTEEYEKEKAEDVLDDKECSKMKKDKPALHKKMKEIAKKAVKKHEKTKGHLEEESLDEGRYRGIRNKKRKSSLAMQTQDLRKTFGVASGKRRRQGPRTARLEEELINEIFDKIIKYVQDRKDAKDRRKTYEIEREYNKTLKKNKIPRNKYSPRDKPRMDRRLKVNKYPISKGRSTPLVNEDLKGFGQAAKRALKKTGEDFKKKQWPDIKKAKDRMMNTLKTDVIPTTKRELSLTEGKLKNWAIKQKEKTGKEATNDDLKKDYEKRKEKLNESLRKKAVSIRNKTVTKANKEFWNRHTGDGKAGSYHAAQLKAKRADVLADVAYKNPNERTFGGRKEALKKAVKLRKREKKWESRSKGK